MAEQDRPITRQVIRDFIEDNLPDAEKATVEKAVRDDAKLQKLIQSVREELDRGEHSVGAIWRRERISCPSREQLGQYIIGASDPALEEYMTFHLETIGCPYCLANLDDLKVMKAKSKPPAKAKPAGGSSRKKK